MGGCLAPGQAGVRGLPEGGAGGQGELEVGGGRAPASGAETGGVGAQAEGDPGGLRHPLPHPRHAPPAWARRPGPAAPVQAPLHPEPAAQRPGATGRGNISAKVKEMYSLPKA